MKRLKRNWLRIVVHIGAWVPLSVLIWNATHDLLSVNPIQDATFWTGKTALILLILSLACTPANTVFGFKRALNVRRALGLYAFMYASIHFLIFTVVDFQLDAGLIWQEIAEKRYVLIGFAALLIMIPMAVTSTKGWMKRLGKRWKGLHRLIYLAAPLVIVHFVWLVKSDIREPLQFGAVVLLLLSLRLPAVRKRVSRLRDRFKKLLAQAWSRNANRPRLRSEMTREV